MKKLNEEQIEEIRELYNPTETFKGVKLNSAKIGEYIRFLQAFGINFKQKDINKLTVDQTRTFKKATEGLLEGLQTKKDVFYWGPKTINTN